MNKSFFNKLKERYLDITNEKVKLKQRVPEARDVVEDVEKFFRDNEEITKAFKAKIAKQHADKSSYRFKKDNRNDFFHFLEQAEIIPDQQANTLKFLYSEGSSWKHDKVANDNKEDSYYKILLCLYSLYNSLFKKEDLSFLIRLEPQLLTDTTLSILQEELDPSILQNPSSKKKITIIISVVIFAIALGSLLYTKYYTPQNNVELENSKKVTAEKLDSISNEAQQPKLTSEEDQISKPQKQIDCCLKSKRKLSVFTKKLNTTATQNISLSYLIQLQKDLIINQNSCGDRDCSIISQLQNLYDQVYNFSEELAQIETEYLKLALQGDIDFKKIEEKQQVSTRLLLYLCQELKCSSKQISAYQNVLKSYTDEI